MSQSIDHAKERTIFHILLKQQILGTSRPMISELRHDRHWRANGARRRLQRIIDLPTSMIEHINQQHSQEYSKQGHAHLVYRSLPSLLHELITFMESITTSQTISFSCQKANEKKLKTLIQELFNRLLDPYGNFSNHSSLNRASDHERQSSFMVKERDTFLRLGGGDCLVQILYLLRARIAGHDWLATTRHSEGNNILVWNQPKPIDVQERLKNMSSIQIRCVNEVLAMLRELCFFTSTLTKHLCYQDGLIIYLFQLLADPRYFDNAAGFVEDILTAREDAFDFSRIPNFLKILRSLSSRQLAYMCRILALMIFDPEDRRILENSHVVKSYSLLKLRRARALRTTSIVDRNHALLFNCPIILSRFLLILKVQNIYFALHADYTPFSSEFAASAELNMLFHHISDRMDWEALEQQLTHPSLDLASGDMEILRNLVPENTGSSQTSLNSNTGNRLNASVLRSLILSIFSMQHSTREVIEAELIMRTIVLAPHRIELLFVISTLLNGKRKVDFQTQFVKLGLTNILTVMFDQFDWTEDNINEGSHSNSAVDHSHDQGCNCSLDTSLKIQFLRVVHNFADRDARDHSVEHFFLSSYEREQFLLGSNVSSFPIDLSYADKGLLAKIILRVVHQPPDSVYRFWLASCVDAFLRQASPKEQLFVARTPLLGALCREVLIGGNFRAQGAFQTPFDIIGEMVKGNAYTLRLFYHALNDSEFSAFMEVVIKNLVDSNVFIRSILISTEKFRLQSETHGPIYQFEQKNFHEITRLGLFLELNAVPLLHDLITKVTMANVNHENICCLNTALAILIFQNRRNQLSKIIQELKLFNKGREQYADNSQSAKLFLNGNDTNKITKDTCANFRELLWFWIEYYSPRGRDRRCLELSSSVKFDEWQNIVSLLCADDGSNTALVNSPLPHIRKSQYDTLYIKKKLK